MVLKPFVCVMMNLWVFVFKFLSQKMSTATTNLYKWVLCFVLFFLLQSTKRNIPMLFVRGDGVVLVAPPLRVG